jgi:hypothetical protein
MSYPAVYTFEVSQNETVKRTLTWTTNGTAVDLTGYTAKMQVKWATTDANALITLTDTSGITLGGSAGTIAITIPYATMQTIPAGYAVYDLQLTSSGGEVTPLIAGDFKIRHEVTS